METLLMVLVGWLSIGIFALVVGFAKKYSKPTKPLTFWDVVFGLALIRFFLK